MSSSTYAHRSREIRQAMFDRKPNVEAFIKAIPDLSHLSYGTIDDITDRPAHPRTSSSSSSSSNQPLQQQPSSTPSRTLSAVPSHQLRTPSQQQQPSTYPTPQTESRVAQHPSEQAHGQPPPPPQPRRMGSYGERQATREPGGSERLWQGDLVIPAHGGGQVLVPCDGWTLGSQPTIPTGLLPHPISLRNFKFVGRPGGIRPDSLALQFRPRSEANAAILNVSDHQMESIRRAPGMIVQLCDTIVSKGALGVVIPGIPEIGQPHLIFDALSFGQHPDGSRALGLVAIVNPAALNIVARMTGQVPVQPQPHLASSPTLSPQQQIHDYARRQQQSQMQQQQYQSHQLPPQQMPDPYLPSPLPRVGSAGDQRQQQYPPISPQYPSYHSQPPTLQFRNNPTISLPPIPSSMPPSSIPRHLQTVEGTSSQEFLNFPSASPEPSLSRPSMDTTSELNTEASYYEGDGSSMILREGDGGFGGTGGEGGGENGRVEEALGGDQQQYEDVSLREEVGGGGNGGGGVGPWRGSMMVRTFSEESPTHVESAEGTVQLRADIHHRYNPLLLPPNLDFFPTQNFEDQNLEIVGRIEIFVPTTIQHVQLVKCCSSAADYGYALLAQMTATDHSSPLPLHQKLVLRLREDQRPREGGAEGVRVELVADVHLAR
ncbi:hypothetical protein BDY24DRAFT_252856 [Mrakia frigida]|uniref:uncharacterized protein n=1 Tax=Mrakia frigida TaxID=29902 RepID=UPI003FCC2509